MAHMNSGVSHSVFFSCDSWENSWWHGEDDLDSDAGSVHSETWCFLLIGWWDVGCGMWDVMTPFLKIFWMGKWWYTNGFYGFLWYLIFRPNHDQPTFSLCWRKWIQLEISGGSTNQHMFASGSSGTFRRVWCATWISALNPNSGPTIGWQLLILVQ